MVKKVVLQLLALVCPGVLRAHHGLRGITAGSIWGSGVHGAPVVPGSDSAPRTPAVRFCCVFPPAGLRLTPDSCCHWSPAAAVHPVLSSSQRSPHARATRPPGLGQPPSAQHCARWILTGSFALPDSQVMPSLAHVEGQKEFGWGRASGSSSKRLSSMGFGNR